LTHPYAQLSGRETPTCRVFGNQSYPSVCQDAFHVASRAIRNTVEYDDPAVAEKTEGVARWLSFAVSTRREYITVRVNVLVGLAETSSHSHSAGRSAARNPLLIRDGTHTHR
jgi:hypothetical protein